MQTKFTLKNVWVFCTKIIALALIFSASSQFSFAQKNTEKSAQQKPGHENALNIVERQKAQQGSNDLQSRNNLRGNPTATNDAGLSNSVVSELPHLTEAICTTWTVSIVASDPTTSLRANRNGTVRTCAAPGTCLAGIAGTFNYKILQWVCPVTQCVTVTYTATNANFGFFTIHDAPPTLTNLCTNWISDPGSSGTLGVPIVFSFNGIGGTTYYFLVTNVAAPPTDCTIQIDAGVCSSTPCSGTPAPGNTVATPNPVGAGSPFTLSVSNNPPVAGLVHYWQSSPTGSAPWTTIGSGPSNTFVTSQTVATWYRDSVVCTPGTQFGISTPVLVNLLACGWSLSTNYPITILDQANVTVGTNLYSFAGVSTAIIANSYKFDGTVWTAIAPTPQPLEFPSAVTDGANIYVMGGASTAGTPLTVNYRYNIATNTYTTLAPFTTGTWNHAAVYLGGKIYKFAGTGPATASTNVLEIYDIASNTWTTGAPYPLAISFVSAIARGGFIYAGGGYQSVGGIASAKTYRYDPVANTWDDAAIADLPATRWGAAADFYNNTFIMAGGYLGGAVTITNTVTAWDQGTNTWSASTNMLGERARMGGAVLSGSFYVIGGRSIASAGFVGTNTNQRLFCIPPTPCTGTPAPGNTLSSANPVCSGVPFTLSLQNNPFVSGFTYLWQSAPAAAGPWTNLPGGTNVTHTLSQTGATWYRAIVTCTPSGLSGTSTPLLVLNGQGVFTSHPVNTSAQCGGNVVFSFTATGNSLTYAWEYRTSPSGPWLNLTGPTLAGATVSGQTTNTLTLTNVSAALNGYQFRGLMQGPCTAVDFTNVATLSVTPYQVIVSPTSASICIGQVQQICIQNSVSGSTTATFSSGPLNFNVPDNIATASTFTIPVSGIPAGSVITDVRIHLNMTHTYPADMVINLKGTHPTNILSLYKHNTNTDNGAVSIPTAGFFDAVCSQTGTIQWRTVPNPFRYGITPPTGPFAADALNGVTNPGYIIMDPIGWVSNAPNFASLIPAAGPNGTWTLAMCDGGPADLGNFTGWSIDIIYTSPVLATGVWTASPAAPNTMFNDAAATIPYVAGTPQSCIYVKPSVNTNYTVVVTTANCVSSPTVVPVTVFTPIVGLTNPANTSACVGNTATFSVSSTSGGPNTYQWQVSTNGGLTYTNIAGATGATLNLPNVTQLMNNNLYRVTATAGPCGSFTTTGASLTVNPLPVVTISAPSLQLTPGQSLTITASSVPGPLNANSWSWTLNHSPIPGATTNSVSVDINGLGVYQARVTDVNGCSALSNELVIGSEPSDRLWIYPNPSPDGRFQVRLFNPGNPSERRVISVYNSAGILVQERVFFLDNIQSPYMQMDFDLSNMPAGAYLLKVAHQHSGNVRSGWVIIR